MSMSKQDFIALADAIRSHNFVHPEFSYREIETLAEFCKNRNSTFMKERWIGYIKGENGPNGRLKK